jgi:hypothetical protein
MTTLTITRKLYFLQGRRTKKIIRAGEKPKRPKARTLRIRKLMALAIRFDQMVRKSEVEDQATLARLGHVTRARITQIMNLLYLAPDIQEKLLNLPQTPHGCDIITCGELQSIALGPDWKIQREKWNKIRMFSI